jgi:hypothetical protein
MGDLKLPDFKKNDSTPRRLSMDEYLEFVIWNMKNTSNQKSYDLLRKEKINTAFFLKN